MNLRDVTTTMPVIVEQIRSQTLAWLKPLRANLDKNGGALNIKELDPIYTHTATSQQGPTAALSMMAALAITLATAGSMSGVGSLVATQAGLTGASATVVQGMTAATLTSLCVSAGNSVLNNTQNPTKAFQDFLGDKTWVGALKAGATGGATAGLGHAFGVAGDAATIGNRMIKAAVNTVATSGVDVAFGESLDQAFKRNAVQSGVSAAAGYGAEKIGFSYASGDLDTITHKIFHGALGAVSGAASGALLGEDVTTAAASRALGAFTAELFADCFGPDRLTPNKLADRIETLEAEKGAPLTAAEKHAVFQQMLSDFKVETDQTAPWAKMVGATGALFTGLDVAEAGQGAATSIDNNFAFAAVAVAGVALSAYDLYAAYRDGGVEGFAKELGIQVVTATAAVGAFKVGQKVFMWGGTYYPTLKEAVSAALDTTPYLKETLGKVADAVMKTLETGVAKVVAVDAALDAKVAASGGKVFGVKGTGQAASNTAQRQAFQKAMKSMDKGSVDVDKYLFKSLSGKITERPVTWASPTGTKQTYKVWQRTDIDWGRVRTAGDKRFIGKTNLEAARAGASPQLPDGHFATLHHLGQDSRGGLVEVSTKLHKFGGSKLPSGKTPFDILHSQHGVRMKHPSYPVDHDVFSKEVTNYWKMRVKG